MSRRTSHDGTNKLCRDWVILVLVTGLAATLRFIALDHLPPGLYHDEAFNGLDALRVIQGQHPIFFEANHGREPLFIYLLAQSVRIWGRSPGALRLVSALVGTLTVPAIYLLGRELFGRRVALLSSLIASSTVWMLNLSRVSFRAVTFVPLMILALLFFWKGWQQKRVLYMALSGLIWGATLYTYLAARFTIVTLLFIIPYLTILRRGRPTRREPIWWLGWLALGCAALLSASPLIVYWLGHWDSTIGRAGQVSILNSTINGGDVWGTLAQHLWRTARGFVLKGDFQPRHNVPKRAVFPWPIAIAFLMGSGLALKRSRDKSAYGLCVIWVGVMLLPTILAEDAPHMLRASGILPMLFFLPAIGLEATYQWLTFRYRQIALIAVISIILVCGLDNFLAYKTHLNSLPVYYQFEAGATQMATDMNRFLGSGWQGKGISAPLQQPRENRVYLSQRLWNDWPSIRYLCEEERLDIFEAKNGLPDLIAEQAMVVMWPPEYGTSWIASSPKDRLIDIQPGAMEMGDQETKARLLYLTMTVSPSENAEPPFANFGDVQLSRYDIEQNAADPTRLLVSLYWTSQEKLNTDYTVFCHALSGEQMIGQHDGQPAWGYAPTSQWRPGDMIKDTHTLELTTAYNPDLTEIRVGLYQRETLERLPLIDSARSQGNTGSNLDRTFVTLDD